jgi:hemerythrin superfamily protein
MATRKTVSKKNASKSKAARGSQDAIALLRADHAKVQDLFDEFEKSRKDSVKEKLAQQICMELTIHTAIEEEIFYPAVREAIKDGDMLDEAEVEHASAKELIAQIEGGAASDDKWSAKVTVLGEYIRHHVKEEQNEMFPKAKKSRLDLKALGEQLATRKQELLSST